MTLGKSTRADGKPYDRGGGAVLHRAMPPRPPPAPRETASRAVASHEIAQEPPVAVQRVEERGQTWVQPVLTRRADPRGATK